MKNILVLCSFALIVLASATALAADGAALYKANCASCHGASGEKEGKGEAPLKDQDASTLMRKLQGYGHGTYGGSGKATMESIVRKHSPEELRAMIEAVARK